MSSNQVIGRIPVLDVRPAVDCGSRPAKAVVGETFEVTATVFREGHDAVAANVVLRDPAGGRGPWTPMRELAPGTDRWGAEVTPDAEGRWTYAVEAWSDPLAHLAARTPAIKIPAGIDTGLVLEEGARAVRAGRRPAFPRATAGRPCWPPPTRCATTSRPAAARLAAALTPEVDAVARPATRCGSWSPPRSRCRCWWSGSGRCSAPGTSSSRARRARRGRSGRSRHLPHRRRAAAGDRRDGLRRGLSAADPPDRHHLPQGPQQHPRPPGPRTSGCRGRSAPPRAATTRSTPTWARSRTSTAFVARGPRPAHGDRPGLRAPVLPRPPLGGEAPGVVPPPRRTARSRTRRTRRRSTRTSTRSPSTRTWTASVAETLRVLRHWMDHGVRIFRVDNPHTKPVVFWEQVIARHQPHRPRRDLPGRGVHPAGDDAHPGADRLPAVVHVLHLAQHQGRS